MFHQQNKKGGKTLKKIAVMAIVVLFSLVSFGYASAQENVAAATKCTYAISPSSNTFPSGGGSGGVDITTQSGCTWTAKSKVSWITLSPSSGTGNGSIVYVVSVNNGAKRTGTMTIAGKTFTVTQTSSTVPPVVFKLPPTLPEACLNETYSYQVPEPSGGLGAPYHFQLGTGAFPPMGIAVGLDGTITGTPVSPGGKTFWVCAVDVGGHSKCMKTTMVVSETTCCYASNDKCTEVTVYDPEGLSPCLDEKMYSCTTASGHGYYKISVASVESYFCCTGMKTEMSCEQAIDNLAALCGVPPGDILPVANPKAGTYSGTCIVTGSAITCCAPDGSNCTTTPPITTTYTFGPIPIPKPIPISTLKKMVCPTLIDGLTAAGCVNPTCNFTSTSNSFTVYDTCTLPPVEGCTTETMYEICIFTD